ncbi:inactive ubiquitin carboxyl-terminal hydrolase 50 isoform X4 [Cavia porcellus]|uniref:inactive ubiquitin carboxyl-terminal hydrolase 50 isoform X4 n=1 Tax=Cavia porcellus TaxID=10141 RepID=UPI002FE186AE
MTPSRARPAHAIAHSHAVGLYYALTERTELPDPLPAREDPARPPNPPGVAGLRNLGNTCYMNAVLQCLASVPPLAQYFRSGQYVTALRKDCREVATAFAYLLTDMWLGDADCVSPEEFRAALGRLHPDFTKRTQQDAQEFLIYVLNALHEALRKYHQRSGEKRSTQRCCSRGIASETSIITQLFEGQLNYSIMCLKCENCSYRNEVFTVLSLPIPSEYECTLQNHFGDLDGGHYTASCRNSVTQAWYSFDDTRVSEIPAPLVQTSMAYLLFYSWQPFSKATQKCRS